jgi:Holliday junction resolvase-like predicted endonuclease
MGKASRDKGQRGEREVCKLLTEALNVDVTRELGASRDGGCDIIVTLGDLTYVIEVKLYRKVTQALVDTWWDQAVSQAEALHDQLINATPILIYRQSHWKYWECRVPFDHMIWQFKCSNVIRDRNNSFVTVPIDVLTDIMLVDKVGTKFKTISKGSIDIHMEK